MKRVILSLVVVVMFGADADACNRCGLFGNRCRFSSHVAVVPAVYQQPNVFVVQNAYPPANGNALLAQQGSTVYGLQASLQNYFVNPAEVLHQASQLTSAANATAQLGLNGYSQIAAMQLQLQANLAQPLAQSAAATQVLRAAGINQAEQTAGQSLALKIVRDANGQWQVTQADPVAVNQQIQQQVNPQQPANPQPVEPAPAESVLTSKCAKCHGAQLTTPKGGLYFAANSPLESGQITKAIRAIASGKMPPKSEPPLSAEDKTAVLMELLSLEPNLAKEVE